MSLYSEWKAIDEEAIASMDKSITHSKRLYELLQRFKKTDFMRIAPERRFLALLIYTEELFEVVSICSEDCILTGELLKKSVDFEIRILKEMPDSMLEDGKVLP